MTLRPPNPNIEPPFGDDLTPARLRELFRKIQENQDFLCQQFPVQAGNLANGPVRGAAEDLVVVRGIVNSAGSGSIVEGEGFSIARNGTGEVTVTYDEAFADVAAVTFGVGSTAAIYNVKHAISATATAFKALCFNSGTGAAVDGIFHFAAFGPR